MFQESQESQGGTAGAARALQAGREAAVDAQDVAVDEAGGGRRQEDDRAAQVFSLGSI